MTTEKDNWSSEAYQTSASFVPKLATKVLEWLDPQPDDIILDIGCGDGVLDLQIARTLSHGTGTLHGIDSSPSMVSASINRIAAAGLSSQCTFQVLDATHIPSTPSLQSSAFTKIFSNASLHWILKPPSVRHPFFRALHSALLPGGTFVFEMGGAGNIAEVRAAVLSAVRRRVGHARAVELEPWFFPDEKWMRRMLEDEVGGWRVERLEREWRPTQMDEGGIEGWVRLMCGGWLDGVGEGEREECVREVVEVLEGVCNSGCGFQGAQGAQGGEWLGYVRLRGVVRRL